MNDDADFVAQETEKLSLGYQDRMKTSSQHVPAQGPDELRSGSSRNQKGHTNMGACTYFERGTSADSRMQCMTRLLFKTALVNSAALS